MAEVKKKELTGKQRLFVKEYLKDFNATNAAIRSGYSKKSAPESGCENLRKSNVKTEILKHFDKLGDVTQKILKEYVNIATSNITDYLDIDEAGQIKYKKVQDLPREISGCISEISEDRVIKDDVTVHDKIKLKLYDKQKALDTLAKIANLLTDKIDITTGGEKIEPIKFVIVKKEKKK